MRELGPFFSWRIMRAAASLLLSVGWLLPVVFSASGCMPWMQVQTPGKSPMQTLFDLATELHRRQPGARTPYTGPDFQQAFKEAREFLADQQTGLVKFFEIVKTRCGGPCPTGN